MGFQNSSHNRNAVKSEPDSLSRTKFNIKSANTVFESKLVWIKIQESVATLIWGAVLFLSAMPAPLWCSSAYHKNCWINDRKRTKNSRSARPTAYQPLHDNTFRIEKDILCLRKPVSDKHYWYMNVKSKHNVPGRVQTLGELLKYV